MQTVSIISEYRAKHDGMTLEAFGAMFCPAVHKATVMRWERAGPSIARAIEIERVTGISRQLLRPDAFGPISIPEAAE